MSFSGFTKMVSTTSSALLDMHQDIARIMMIPGTSFYICLVMSMCDRLKGGGPRHPQPSYTKTGFGDMHNTKVTRNQCFPYGMSRYVTSGQERPPPPWAPPGPPPAPPRETTPQSRLWPCARRPAHQSSSEQANSGTSSGWTPEPDATRSRPWRPSSTRWWWFPKLKEDELLAKRKEWDKAKSQDFNASGGSCKPSLKNLVCCAMSSFKNPGSLRKSGRKSLRRSKPKRKLL